MMPLWTSASRVGRVRMGVAPRSARHGSPSGCGRCRSGRRAASVSSRVLEIPELALGAAAGQVAAFERGDAGRIVAAIFEPLQRVDEERRDRRRAENSDDAAHAPDDSPSPAARPRLAAAPAYAAEITSLFRNDTARAAMRSGGIRFDSGVSDGVRRAFCSRGIAPPSPACRPAGRGRRASASAGTSCGDHAARRRHRRRRRSSPARPARCSSR